MSIGYPFKLRQTIPAKRSSIHWKNSVTMSHIKNMIGDDMYVVLIFNSHSDSIDRIDFKPDYENILLEPQMISRALWTPLMIADSIITVMKKTWDMKIRQTTGIDV